jgi:hypothetical protein
MPLGLVRRGLVSATTCRIELWGLFRLHKLGGAYSFSSFSRSRGVQDLQQEVLSADSLPVKTGGRLHAMQ